MQPAEQLQRVLGASGLSQTELAKRLNVSFVTLNSWVNGRSIPRQKSQEAINALFAEVVGGSVLNSSELTALIKNAERQSVNPKKLVDDKELLDKFTLAFTYNTNTIEGSTMTVADTEAVLFEGKTIQGRTLVEQLEAKNHQAALWWLVEQVRKSHFEITPSLISQLHVRLMNGIMSDAGAYRRHPVRIAGSRTTVANHRKISALIDELCAGVLNNGTSLVALLGRQHAEFERIHPFADGNGRVGRLLMMAIALQHNNVPPIVLRERRAVYYKALELAQMDADFALLEQFLAESIIKAQSDIFD